LALSKLVFVLSRRRSFSQRCFELRGVLRSEMELDWLALLGLRALPSAVPGLDDGAAGIRLRFPRRNFSRCHQSPCVLSVHIVVFVLPSPVSCVNVWNNFWFCFNKNKEKS
jgi:hypothetical protein